LSQYPFLVIFIEDLFEPTDKRRLRKDITSLEDIKGKYKSFKNYSVKSTDSSLEQTGKSFYKFLHEPPPVVEMKFAMIFHYTTEVVHTPDLFGLRVSSLRPL